MPLTQRVLEILDGWREHNPLFRYNRDSRGNIFFPFKNVMVQIIFPETVSSQMQNSWHINCYVNPRTSSKGGLLPDLFVDFPFNMNVLNILWGYYNSTFFPHFTVGISRKAVAVSSTVFLPNKLLSAASLHHSLVELSSGHWYLVKEFFNAGLLEDTLSLASSESRDHFESLMYSFRGMQMGCFDMPLGKLNFKEKWCPLPFNNLIGYKPKQQERIDALFQKFPAHARIGNINVYSIDSKSLKSLIWPIRDLITKSRKKFKVETLHQGFPAHTFRRQTLADYQAFLGVRFSVEIADAESFSREEIEEWKESLLFQPDPTFVGRYSFGEDKIRFNINLPIFLVEKHHLLLPEIDAMQLGGERLEHAIARPRERMQRDVEVWRKMSQRIRAVTS